MSLINLDATIVSEPLKLTKCAEPPIFADCTLDTPRKPKSFNTKSTKKSIKSSSYDVQSSKDFLTTLRTSRDNVATVIGYQTCRSIDSKKLVNQAQFSSRLSITNNKFLVPTTVPSGTAFILMGNLPSYLSTM